MSKPAHVFVCYSALSLDAARRLASVVSDDPAKCFFLVLFGAADPRLPQGANVAAMLPPAEAYSEVVRPFAIARWFAQWLATEGSNIEEIAAYIPHPLEIPGNHFAFFEPRVNRLELLPDGLINYYDHLLDPESPKKRLFYRARMGLRQLAARLHGLRYEFLPEGHITQYERGTYSRTWTENRTGMVSVSGTLEVLPPRDPKAEGAVSGGGEVLLILDQELGQLVDEALESRMRERLSAEVQSSGFRSILYKCHPRGRNRHGWFCNRLGRDIEDLSGPLLAEELVELRGATSIVGFYSTPLILSAAQVNTRVAILPAPGQSGVRRPRRLTEIRSALERTGVRIIPP